MRLLWPLPVRPRARDEPDRKALVRSVHREREMTALVEGSWSTIGVLAFTAAGLSLGSAFVYLVLTWRQDREERTRPMRRGLVSVEESNAEIRRAGSVAGLVFTAVAIL